MNRPLFQMTDIAGPPIWDISKFAAVHVDTQISGSPPTPQNHNPAKSTSGHYSMSDASKPSRPIATPRALEFWLDQPQTFWNFQNTGRSTRSSEQLKMLYDQRTAIFDECIGVYQRERLRQTFCWFDWEPLISNLGETAVTLWKSIISDEIQTKKRFTLPISDPNLLVHLNSHELDHLSKLYIVRLETAYRNLHKLLKGEYANVISDFERESIARMPQIIPEIMQALSQINPHLDAVIKYYGRIAEYKRMLNFIETQTD